MGIQNNPIPPHYKIERLIRQSGIPCTFLRPSFFMQNLNTTHAEDIKNRSEIFLPAGNSMVSFVDTRDIGEAAAKVLLNNNHLHKSYTLTGSESLTYTEVARIFSQELGRPISYSNPSPLRFRREMIARGVAKEFANVMVALYLTTRLGMAKAVTSDLKYLLGRDPRTVQEYVRDYRQVWL